MELQFRYSCLQAHNKENNCIEHIYTICGPTNCRQANGAHYIARDDLRK